MNSEQWPFDQPPNCAVCSLRSIIFGGTPILYVTHDADDDGWQFLDGSDVSIDDAAVVRLDEIVQRDATVVEIADLPPGWAAKRKTQDAPSLRGPR